MASKRGVKRRERQRMCESKKRHSSFKNAMIARKVGGEAYRQTLAYLCKFCNLWHLGHAKRHWKQAPA